MLNTAWRWRISPVGSSISVARNHKQSPQAYRSSFKSNNCDVILKLQNKARQEEQQEQQVSEN
jgi:hypothetical protein